MRLSRGERGSPYQTGWGEEEKEADEEGEEVHLCLFEVG